MTLTECNDWCRRLAAQLLDELCNSIIGWLHRRRLSVRHIQTLHKVGRNAAGCALAAERHNRLTIVMPANMLPA